MSQTDYLVTAPSLQAVLNAVPAGWKSTDPDTGKVILQLPQWCQYDIVDAYTVLGTPGTQDADGNILTPGTPPTKAAGVWLIVTLDKAVNIPAGVQGAIKAQGDRDAGLKLPAGIVGLSAVPWGMTLAS